MAGVGRIFAVSDRRTRDSGNASYGVEVGGWRYFVKTAGGPDDDSPFLNHAARVRLARNAAALAEHGWGACDFYDGAMICDFRRRRVRAVDPDCCRRGAFVNEMGRMFGSSRFTAPEEFELGAVRS